MTSFAQRRTLDRNARDWLILCVRAGNQPRLFRFSPEKTIAFMAIMVIVTLVSAYAIGNFMQLKRAQAALLHENNKLTQQNTLLDRQKQALQIQLEASLQRIDALEGDRSRLGRGLERERSKVKQLNATARTIAGKVERLNAKVEDLGSLNPNTATRTSTGSRSNKTASTSDGGLGLLQSLFGQLSNSDRRAKAVVASLEAKADQEARIPSGWPVKGPITSTFGYRIGPRTGKLERHTGWDIASAQGTAAMSTGAGTVVTAGWSEIGYGLHVVVDHGNGLKTLYGHLSQIDLKVGDEVKIGTQIGLVGSTGNSTGPHLHYEVRLENTAVDPGPFLDRERPATPMLPIETPTQSSETPSQPSKP